jgi:hypothetical protein
MIHVHTFKDLSEANLAATWGMRYARGQRHKVFPHSNPYRLMEVSDHFGKHARVPNLPADRELRQVTITKTYWPDRDAPAEVREMEQRREREDLQLRKMGVPNGDRRYYVHCQEWLEGAGDYLQYKLFMRRADSRFLLRAKGQPDVSCRVSMSFYTDRSRNLCELEVVIPPAEYARMARGVGYTLSPRNSKKGFEWKVRDGVKLFLR